jgi:hypothetical protein
LSALPWCACVAAIAAVGCTKTTEVCTAILINAIGVSVVDSATGLPAAAGTTLIAIRDGVQYDSVTTRNDPSDDADIIAAGNQPGTFNLTLKKALYRNWTRTGLVVPSGDPLRCHPQTVHLVASIQKLP